MLGRTLGLVRDFEVYPIGVVEVERVIHAMVDVFRLHTGGRKLLSIRLHRLIVRDFHRHMLMPAAPWLEVLGPKGLFMVEKSQEVAIRHLEEKMTVLRSVIAERIVQHHRVDERHTEQILVEFPGLFGVATAKSVMVNVQKGVAPSGFLDGGVIV